MENELTYQTIDKLDRPGAEALLKSIIRNAELFDEEILSPNILKKEIFIEGINNSDIFKEFNDLKIDESDVNQQALKVLITDDDYNGFFNGYEEPPRELPQNYSFDPQTVITSTTLCLIVLSTYVHLKKDKDGKWTFEFKIMPASNSLKMELLKLIKKLTSGLPEGN